MPGARKAIPKRKWSVRILIVFKLNLENLKNWIEQLDAKETSALERLALTDSTTVFPLAY